MILNTYINEIINSQINLQTGRKLYPGSFKLRYLIFLTSLRQTFCFHDYPSLFLSRDLHKRLPCLWQR